MKIQQTPKTIPTILGLGLLFTAIFLGLTIFFYNQEFRKRVDFVNAPKNAQVVNISDSKATVIWETNIETTGSLVWGKEGNLSNITLDDRDQKDQKVHQVHIVTLRDLSEEVTYEFQIKNNGSLSKALSFKTGKKLPTQPETVSKKGGLTNKPVIGKILDPNLEPTKEALIVLNLTEGSTQATVTSTAGNFILPLVDLRSKDLDNYLIVENNLPGQLEIYSNNQVTKAKITLPLNGSLPPIILGQQTDLTQSSRSATIKKNPIDLNGDNKINAVDLSIIIANLGKRGNNLSDLNADQIVDQKDIDIISKALK